jgi:hypothetical protein
VVALDGASFVARRDNPGECPGAGWQLIARQGQRGVAGPRGDRGLPGLSTPFIKSWTVDRAAYAVTPKMSDGSSGPILELRSLFMQYDDETNPADQS